MAVSRREDRRRKNDTVTEIHQEARHRQAEWGAARKYFYQKGRSELAGTMRPDGEIRAAWKRKGDGESRDRGGRATMKIERAKICPYCGKTGGDFNDEHLIPQCLTKPHTKRRPPDFECHVECNNSKSKFDEMLCDILKLTVRSDQIQEREISNMLKGRNSELSNIINMHAENINYPIVEINMDIFARFVYIYGDYLARGWYFILKGKILNKNRYLVYTEYDNQFVSGYLKKTIPSEGRDCFHDLEKNEKPK